jgi:EAL domain-containing protein (putative c-di-GMP-specific phosphodiesterase class I)
MNDLVRRPAGDESYSSALGRLLPEERCARCEVLPERYVGGGSLFLGLPVAFTVRKTLEYLRSTKWTFEQNPRFVVIEIPAGAFDAYSTALSSLFTAVETDAIRALFIPTGREPAVADFLETDSLTRFLARSQAQRLETTIEGYLQTAFQPIVDAASLTIFGYEALLRTASGSPLSGPGEVFAAASAADLLPHTDLAARRTAIASAAATGLTGNLFLNFVPSAIYDPVSCLRSTTEALDRAGISHDRVIFEVVESDKVTDSGYLLKILRQYRSAGFRVALDDLGSGFSSLNLLHELRPDFVKLDIALVRDVDRDPFKATLASKIIEAARELHMIVIAEGIETAAEFNWMRENGADLLQGFHIARPQTEPASVISPDVR